MWLYSLLDTICAPAASGAYTWKVWLSTKSHDSLAAAEAALARGGRAACVDVSLEPGGNWGREAAAYLRFIVENWRALPDAAVFVHGSALEHTPALAQWLPCLDARWPEAGRFASVSPHFMAGQLSQRAAPSFDTFARAARAAVAAAAAAHGSPPQSDALVDLSFSPTAHMCCASFVASRAAMAAHPRWWWAALLQVLLTEGREQSVYEGVPDQWAAAYLEQVWHHIMGEALTLPEPTKLCRAPGAPFLDSAQCPGSPCGEKFEAERAAELSAAS